MSRKEDLTTQNIEDLYDGLSEHNRPTPPNPNQMKPEQPHSIPRTPNRQWGRKEGGKK